MSLNDAMYLQADLDNLSEWCQENDLSFNATKSCLLHFCNRARDVTLYDYSINGTDITSQDHFRDLGVIFSSDLSWTEYYNTLTAKAYQTLDHFLCLYQSESRNASFSREVKTDILFIGVET